VRARAMEDALRARAVEDALRLQSLERFTRRIDAKDRRVSVTRRAEVEAGPDA